MAPPKTSRSVARAASKRLSKRRAASSRAGISKRRSINDLNYIPMKEIHKIMEQMIGKPYKIAEGASFGVSYLMEMIAQFLIKQSIIVMGKNVRKGATIMPLHVMKGIQLDEDSRDGMARLLSHANTSGPITKLNSQINSLTSTRKRGRQRSSSPESRDGSFMIAPRSRSRSSSPVSTMQARLKRRRFRSSNRSPRRRAGRGKGRAGRGRTARGRATRLRITRGRKRLARSRSRSSSSTGSQRRSRSRSRSSSRSPVRTSPVNRTTRSRSRSRSRLAALGPAYRANTQNRSRSGNRSPRSTASRSGSSPNRPLMTYMGDP